jgi:hypothetical protein
MTLKETFLTYSLTSGQNSLIDELDKFLSDDSISCFLLKGYAGTGKTFMIKGLTDFLRESKRNFRIAAPTGRAAKVISQRTQSRAYTIHRTIYSNQNLQEFKATDEDGVEGYKFYYELRHNEDSLDTIYIIDEASMLSNVYSEGEFFRFGSGCLLQDLIEYVGLSNGRWSRKIIFVGDTAQLPPVNMNFSPALDANYLKETCGLTSNEFELTEVVRQKEDSGILHNATALRKSLSSNIFNKLDIETGFKDIVKTKHEDLLTQYIQACNNSIDEETIIVAYSNSSAKEYNDFVRNHFFPSRDEITARDKVILVANNYSHPEMELLNGDFGIVMAVASVNEVRTITVNNKQVSLTFRDVTISFTDTESQKHDVKCKIIENLLYSSPRDLGTDELKAIYIDFKIRHPELKSGTKEFKDAIRSDVYFNALRIKYGYAVTCHKAQGGEWKNVFLNCRTSMGYSNSSYFRWLYTGITRAKETLFTLDEPHFTIGGGLQTPKVDNGKLRKDIIALNADILELKVPFDFSIGHSFAKHIFFAINEYLKDENITISNIRHTNYLEHYTFSQGSETALFKVHYNGQNKITTIQKPANSSALIERIYVKLAQIQDKTIIIAGQEPEHTRTEFEFGKPFLREFYDNIKGKLEPSNFCIATIDHNNWHEIYEIRKGEFMATYKFWYDGKGIFKKTEIIPTRTTGLVDEINELLK